MLALHCTTLWPVCMYLSFRE